MASPGTAQPPVVVTVVVATVVVTPENDAPVLDNSGAMTLTTINEDQVSNVGNMVSAIIASASGVGLAVNGNTV